MTPEERTRFAQLQAECAAGLVPTLVVGDIIYVDTAYYVHHGRDDFQGGLAHVCGVREDVSPHGRTPFVSVVENDGTWYNWQILAAKQASLAVELGESWSRPDPDDRPEFNE